MFIFLSSQLSDSPLSDYNVEFTRTNRSVDSITPSSLSSLSIPATSNLSLTLGTPPNRKSRWSVAKSRSSYTPRQILENKQRLIVRSTLGKKNIIPKGFSPKQYSTPNQFERKKSSIIPVKKHTDKTGTESVASSSPNQRARDNRENKSRLKHDQTNRTLTQELSTNGPVSTTLVPETQPNDSVIPATQDDYVPESQENEISDTQDDHVPETQENEIPVTQDHYYVAETQENEIPDNTQNDLENNPVQAQVKRKKIIYSKFFRRK